jgi:thioredoxin reductase
VSNENTLQNHLLEASDENNRQLKRIADSLEELLSMIKGVQPAELAEKAKQHKTAQANLKRRKKNE